MYHSVTWWSSMHQSVLAQHLKLCLLNFYGCLISFCVFCICIAMARLCASLLWFGLVTTYASKQVFIIWLGWWWYRIWARENPINSRSGMLDWICQFHLFSSRRSMYCAPLGLVILVDVISTFFTHMNKLCELLCFLSTCWSDWCGLCAMFLSSARWKFNSLLLLVVDLLQITTPRKIWKFLIVFWSFLGIYYQPRCICI